MQIRAFIQYFDGDTEISIKSKRTENDKAKFITLVELTVNELISVSQYYNSILDMNIQYNQVFVVGGRVHITLLDV